MRTPNRGAVGAALHPLAASILATALLTGAGTAQRDGPLVGPADRLERAKTLAESGHHDRALVELWYGRDAVREMTPGVVRGRLRQEIDEMIESLDPIPAEIRAETDAAIAQEIAKVAGHYVRKKWHITAVGLLRIAAAYDPVAMNARVDRIEQRIAEAARKDHAAARREDAKEAAERKSLLESFEPEKMQGKWTVRPGELRSPELAGKSVYVYDKRELRDGVLRAEIATGDRSAMAGVMFGAWSDRDYYVALLAHDIEQGYSSLSIAYYNGDTNLIESIAATSAFTKAAQRIGWLPLAITIRGKRVKVVGPAGMECEADLPRPAHGGFGAWIPNNSPSKDPVAFGGFRLEPLPSEDAASPNAVVRSRPGEKDNARILLESVGVLKPRLKDIDEVELACLELRALRRRAFRLAPGAVRSAVVESIERLLAEHDPVDTKRTVGAVECAKLLAGLARRYADADFPVAADLVLLQNQGFDVATTEAVRAELANARGAVPAAERGYPAEVHDESDNRGLRVWFENGRAALRNANWTWSEAEVVSPALESGSAMLLSENESDSFGRVHVQVQQLGREAYAGAALVFGHRTDRDYWVASVQALDGQGHASLSIQHYLAPEWHLVTHERVRFEPGALNGWMTIEVEFEPSRVRAKFGTAPAIEAELGDARTVRPGRFGLWGSDGVGAVAFRDFGFGASDK